MNRLSLWLPALLYVALLVAGARWEPHLAMLDLNVSPAVEPLTLSRHPRPEETPVIDTCYNEATVYTWDNDGRLWAKCVPVHWVTSPPSSR